MTSPRGGAGFTRIAVTAVVAGCVAAMAHAHDVTTRVSWNREISRIVYARCAGCHRPGGQAFSLLTYQEANPWAAAIRDSVLKRTMPPWGAVKGFGSFRNEQALSQEELGLVENWANGGAPEGNPNDLPPRPRIAAALLQDDGVTETLAVSDRHRFARPVQLDSFQVATPSTIASAQITVAFPDGRIVPLVWLHDYSTSIAHPFELRTPLSIPVGALVRGVPPGAVLRLRAAATTPAGR